MRCRLATRPFFNCASRLVLVEGGRLHLLRIECVNLVAELVEPDFVQSDIEGAL